MRQISKILLNVVLILGFSLWIWYVFAETVAEVKTKIAGLQASDPSLPSIANQKWTIWTILANIFDASWKIKPDFLDLIWLGWMFRTNWTKIYYNDGNVGIGTNNPNAKLEVNWDILIQNWRQIIFSNNWWTSKDFWIKSTWEHFSIVETEENNKEYFKIEDDASIYIKPSWNTAMTLNKTWNVWIATSPRTDSYKLSMWGSIHMNNKDINYVNQLHFNDNVRFYDDWNDNYINFKYWDSGAGWIKIHDWNNGIQWYIYSWWNNNDFWLLDWDGHWWVRISKGDYVELRDNNEVTFRAWQWWVSWSYGTVQTHGWWKSGREWYSINGRYVLMSDDNENVWIYNDVDNRWVTLYDRNDYYRIYEPDSSNVAVEVKANGNIKVRWGIRAYTDSSFDCTFGWEFPDNNTSFKFNLGNWVYKCLYMFYVWSSYSDSQNDVYKCPSYWLKDASWIKVPLYWKKDAAEWHNMWQKARNTRSYWEFKFFWNSGDRNWNHYIWTNLIYHYSFPYKVHTQHGAYNVSQWWTPAQWNTERSDYSGGAFVICEL